MVSLRRVYWEVTAGCNLRCIHCRRTDVLTKGSPQELTTQQAKSLVDQLAQMGKPVLILSGGEPLFRKDIFEIARYAKDQGLPVGIATNGTLIKSETAQALKEAGIYYASISLDGARPATHDAFRGKGNFDRAIRGFLHLKEAGIKVQINFTVTKKNVQEVPEMHQLAQALGAYALYLFLLVPVGCGVQIADSQMLSTEQVEEWLQWVVKKDKEGALPLKAICAPHYYRIEAEFGSEVFEGSLPSSSEMSGIRPQRSFLTNGSSRNEETSRKGCLAGIHMCFVSHKGDVFPCGYLPVSCGNVSKTPFREIWENSSILRDLREPQQLKGRCGRCAFKVVCGGCRARAYYSFQDMLGEEPYCSYQPQAAA